MRMDGVHGQASGDHHAAQKVMHAQRPQLFLLLLFGQGCTSLCSVWRANSRVPLHRHRCSRFPLCVVLGQTDMTLGMAPDTLSPHSRMCLGA